MAIDYANEPQRGSNGVYVDASDVVSGLYRFANFTRSACKKAAKDYAEWAEEYMKKYAPWQNRTGEARRKLKAEYVEQGIMSSSQNTDFSVGVRLSHGVKYGIYLEYNGLYTRSYLSRRRPILVDMLSKDKTQEFLDSIRVQFAKIHKV